MLKKSSMGVAFSSETSTNILKQLSKFRIDHVFKRYDDGSYVTGTWNHGIRHGPFTFDTNKQESEVRNILKY